MRRGVCLMPHLVVCHACFAITHHSPFILTVGKNPHAKHVDGYHGR